MPEKKPSLRVQRLRQEVFDLHDVLNSQLSEEQKRYTKSGYYIEKIAEQTGYSESHIKQLLRYRYKKNR